VRRLKYMSRVCLLFSKLPLHLMSRVSSLVSSENIRKVAEYQHFGINNISEVDLKLFIAWIHEILFKVKR
jgi:hypothetical protein